MCASAITMAALTALASIVATMIIGCGSGVESGNELLSGTVNTTAMMICVVYQALVTW